MNSHMVKAFVNTEKVDATAKSPLSANFTSRSVKVQRTVKHLEPHVGPAVGRHNRLIRVT